MRWSVFSREQFSLNLSWLIVPGSVTERVRECRSSLKSDQENTIAEISIRPIRNSFIGAAHRSKNQRRVHLRGNDWQGYGSTRWPLGDTDLRSGQVERTGGQVF